MLFETQNKGEVKMKIFDKNYDLESVIERSNLITDAMKVFGDEEVFMKCSDALSYIFKNSTEAISFIIYRVKEMEPELPKTVRTFTKCNLYYVPDSGHKILDIYTELESYWIKSLDSFYFNKNHKEAQKTSFESEMKEMKPTGKVFIDDEDDADKF
jgi:hypothetical protein